MTAPLTLDVDRLLERALELPPELRELVAHRLWESLHPDDEIDLSPEQLIEIDRRMDDLDAGRVVLVDGDEALAQLRAKLATTAR